MWNRAACRGIKFSSENAISPRAALFVRDSLYKAERPGEWRSRRGLRSLFFEAPPPAESSVSRLMTELPGGPARGSVAAGRRARGGGAAVCAVAVRDTRVPPAASHMIVVRTPAVWGTAERRGGRAAGAPAAGRLGLGLGRVRDRRRRLAVVRGRLRRLDLGCGGLSLPRAAPPQRRRVRSWGTRTVRSANAPQCRSGGGGRGGERTFFSARTLASFSASRSSFVISGTASPPALRAARPAFFRHRHTHTLPRL